MNAMDEFRHKFPIRQPVCYTVRRRSRMPEEAVGETIYISSREVAFTTERTLGIGQRVEMTVNWPVLLERTCRLKLNIRGHVKRSDASTAVIGIEHYEFRTRASGPLFAPMLGAVGLIAHEFRPVPQS